MLGVTRRATNAAIKGELGRYPLKIQFYVSAIKYFARLLEQPSKSLLFEAYSENMLLHNSNKPNWISTIYKIINVLNLQEEWNVTCQNIGKFIKLFVEHCKSSLRKMYKEVWLQQINGLCDKKSDTTSFKLRTYCKF